MDERQERRINAKCEALYEQNVAYLMDHKQADLMRIALRGPDPTEEDIKLVKAVFTQFNYAIFSRANAEGRG